MMMATEIIDAAGGISASWFLAILVMIVGFFLVRSINKFEKRMEEMEKQQTLITNILMQALVKLDETDGKFFSEHLLRDF